MLLYIVAGELSGDKHGALMLKELKTLIPDCKVKGLGGPKMHDVYPDVEDWADDAAVVGIVEVLKHIRFFHQRFYMLLDRIKWDQPEALVLIDYPGFNLRMAEAVRKACPQIKIIYFISPQVWAWHRGRIPKMARDLDLMLCIFPFEKPLFEESGLKTEFVGHPLVDDVRSRRNDGIRQPGLVGLFPGSRTREIEHHFPVMLQMVKTLQDKHPDWKFETSASSEKFAHRLHELCLKNSVDPSQLHISTTNYHDLMDRARSAVIASGTATMEAALHHLPYVLIYKVNPLTYWMGRKLIKIPYLGMVNILSGREVVKELIQGEFNAEQTAAEIERLMTPEGGNSLVKDMQAAVDKLGPGGAAQRAAAEIACLMNTGDS